MSRRHTKLATVPLWALVSAYARQCGYGDPQLDALDEGDVYLAWDAPDGSRVEFPSVPTCKALRRTLFTAREYFAKKIETW